MTARAVHPQSPVPASLFAWQRADPGPLRHDMGWRKVRGGDAYADAAMDSGSTAWFLSLMYKVGGGTAGFLLDSVLGMG